MAISYTTTDSTAVTGQQAKDQVAANKKAQTVGKQTTDKGTLITRSVGGELDGTSFLKIMIAEMKNIDPSSSQDNTQYVTQMAQMTTMQQMNDLNKTMSAYSYQSLLGKGVTMDVQDSDGSYYTGIVRGVSKENNTWYLSVDVKDNGKVVNKIFEASTLKSVLGVPDTTNQNMLVNSDFNAASNLASNKDNKVVILATDDKGTKSIVKGTVKSTFLDNGVVKIRVATFDADGKESDTTTDYPYASIIKAGNLTDKDMNVKVEDYVTSSSSTTTNTASSNTTTLVNSKTEVKGSSSTSSSTNVSSQLQKLQEVLNG